MDFFEQFIFAELEESYRRSKLNEYDYEDLYERFTHMDYLEEVKPYIYAMRFLGLGTKAEPDIVLKELATELSSISLDLKGLFYDLRILSGTGNSNDSRELDNCVKNGYSDKYLKAKSSLHSKHEPAPVKTKETVISQTSTKPENVIFKRMSFEGCGYSGLYFTSGDIDYLNAKVFIEPMKTTRKFSVRSQIYAGDEPFSKVFSNEYTLKPGDEWFITTGWGNKNFNCYGNRVYRWIIEFDGDENDTHSQEFRFYKGPLKKSGVPVKDIKLFASKATGAIEADRNKYAMSFDGSKLEYVYFKLFIDAPGEVTTVQVFYKITCLEDNSVFYNNYVLHPLESNYTETWYGIGFSEPGKWKKGLYKYSIHVGSGPIHEDMFTVY